MGTLGLWGCEADLQDLLKEAYLWRTQVEAAGFGFACLVSGFMGFWVSA